MELSQPLMSLMRELDATALGVLARGGAELTGRQVARLAGSKSPDSIRLALHRLADAGLVIARTEPQATIYSANREHLLWAAIEAALNSRAELEHRIRNLASGSVITGVTIAIYGSVARGDSTRSSDVDLLVIFPDETTSETRDEFVAELRTHVEHWTGNETQIYDLSRSDLVKQRADGDPIVQSWLAEAIVLTGEPLRNIASDR